LLCVVDDAFIRETVLIFLESLLVTSKLVLYEMEGGTLLILGLVGLHWSFGGVIISIF